MPNTMTLTNPATAQLRAPGAPITGYDLDINAAIVRFVAQHGPRTFTQIGEVFLPAPAAGCNAEHVRSLKRRLNFLTATGALQRTVGITRVPRWRANSHAL